MYELLERRSAEGIKPLDKMQALDQFLATVERRAFRLAFLATGKQEDALDIVQDAMFKLASKYADKDSTEWGPLFHRILQSTIRDWYRRQKVRNRWKAVLSFASLKLEQDESEDPFEQVAGRESENPMERLSLNQSMQHLEVAIQALPLRQQQAFILRAWENLSVEETAQAMGCTQGSVKTHYSRALKSLREHLESYQ